MQADLKNFFPLVKDISEDECPNALSVMASMWKNPSDLNAVAAAINEKYAGKKIIALATFLPELTSFETNQEAWEATQQALCFLISLCRKMQLLGHPVSTIQIVAGSRADGVELADEHGQTKAYTVNRLCIEKAVDRLIRRLTPVAEFAAQSPPIQIALELEPGPWFTIGGAASLKLFCERIDANPNNALYQVVGVNLDIPHWDFLSGISVEWLRKPENEVIRKRIIHCHISDHSNGHFGCHIMGMFHGENQFKEWIALIAEINLLPKDQTRPNYSGYVSCEMEGCKHSRFVQIGADELARLVG